MKSKLLILASIVIVNVGCSSTKNDSNKTMNDTNSLTGTWVLDQLDATLSNGKSISELFPNKTPNLTLDETSKKVSGTDGCNQIMGTYESKSKGQISIGNRLASTQMACAVDNSRIFTNALSSSSKYVISNNQLMLMKDDVVVARFSKVITTELNGTWVLEKINALDRSAKTLDMRFPKKKPTLICDGAKFSGSTGCNGIGGTLTSGKETVSFKDVITTFMFCEEVDENAYLTALNSVTNYKIENQKLFLYAGDRIVLVYGNLKQKR
ncbi:MAG: META domain-containing protein [Flavobacterium sp.]|nr:META domain-containing protein [Candidatus Neoflavobacterium equi]